MPPPQHTFDSSSLPTIFFVNAHGGYPQHGDSATIPDGCYAVHRVPFGVRELFDERADSNFMQTVSKRPHAALYALQTGRLLRYHPYNTLPKAAPIYCLRSRSVYKEERVPKVPSYPAGRLKPTVLSPGSTVPDKLLTFEDRFGTMGVYQSRSGKAVKLTLPDALTNKINERPTKHVMMSEVMDHYGPGMYIFMTCSGMVPRICSRSICFFGKLYDHITRGTSTSTIKRQIQAAPDTVFSVDPPPDTWRPMAASVICEDVHAAI